MGCSPPRGRVGSEALEWFLVLILGQDATDATIAFHPDWVWEKKMPLFCIGELDIKDRSVSVVSKEYRLLEKKLHSLGLFETRYSFFIGELAKFLILWFFIVYFCTLGEKWAYFLSATCAGLMWHQAAFFSHDGF